MTTIDKLLNLFRYNNEAIILLAYVINKNKEFVLAHPEYKLHKNHTTRFKKCIKELNNHKPLSYITRNKEFYNLSYYVNHNTLIPRPETESIVDFALKYISSSANKKIRVFEIGTGSGCISISILANTTNCIIESIDKSEKALYVARLNRSKILNGKERKNLHFKNKDIFEYSPEKHFDLVLSNPPYIPTEEYKKLPLTIFNFEPKEALDGGKDGMDIYKRIATLLNTILSKHGLCILEINSDYYKQISDIFSTRWYTKLIKDYQGLNRFILIAHKPSVIEHYSLL